MQIAAVADKVAVVDSGNQMVRLLRKSCLPYYILVLGTCRACETPLCPLGFFRAPCVGLLRPSTVPSSSLLSRSLPSLPHGTSRSRR